MTALAAALLGGVLLAGPAPAQERGPPATETDRRMGLRGGPATDRYPSAAAHWDAELQRNWESEFTRGYRIGQSEERARGTRLRPGGFHAGLAWNDTHQGEAYERLERAAAELRRALVLIGRQPSLPRVNAALVQARDALERTQNALTWLPSLPDRDGGQRYERARGVGPERASGGWEG